MKKSRSSVPLFADKEPPDPAPPVRYEGLFAIAGLPDPDPPLPPTPPFVAIAVGKTNEGESLPAKPVHRQMGSLIVANMVALLYLALRTLYRYSKLAEDESTSARSRWR